MILNHVRIALVLTEPKQVFVFDNWWTNRKRLCHLVPGVPAAHLGGLLSDLVILMEDAYAPVTANPQQSDAEAWWWELEDIWRLWTSKMGCRPMISTHTYVYIYMYKLYTYIYIYMLANVATLLGNHHLEWFAWLEGKPLGDQASFVAIMNVYSNQFSS